MSRGIREHGFKNSAEVAYRIYKENEKLIYWCLKKFLIAQNDYDDCYQEAAWGLYYCALYYREDAGTSFATYAVPSISGRIQRYLRERKNIIRLSRKMIDNKYAIAKYTEENNIVDGQILDWIQLEEIGITEKEYYETIQVGSVASLEDKIDMKNGDKAELADVVPDKNNTEEEIFNNGYILVDEFLDFYKKYPGNTEVKANIFRDACDNIIMGYGIRQRELAEKYGFSQSYISRIVHKMMDLFKTWYTRNYLKDR